MFRIDFEKALVSLAALRIHPSELVELALLKIHPSAIEGRVNIDDFLVALGSGRVLSHTVIGLGFIVEGSQ
jgi:hypothetical protein